MAVLATRFASAPAGSSQLTEPRAQKFGDFLGFTDFDAASYGHWPCSNWTTEHDSDAWVESGLDYDKLKVEDLADFPLFRHLEALAMEDADNKLVDFEAGTTSGGQGASLMYLSIGNRQHFRWNSKDQRGLGMRRFASTRSGSATR